MEDTLTRTTDTILDTIASVSNEVITVVEEASNNWWFLYEFWGYWFPAIILITAAIFFRRFTFTNSSINYSYHFNERNKDDDTRFRNIYGVIMVLLGLCPYVNWGVLIMLICLSIALVTEQTFPLYLNKEKFYQDKLMNFLFNGEMEKPKNIVTKDKEETYKDL